MHDTTHGLILLGAAPFQSYVESNTASRVHVSALAGASECAGGFTTVHRCTVAASRHGQTSPRDVWYRVDLPGAWLAGRVECQHRVWAARARYISPLNYTMGMCQPGQYAAAQKTRLQVVKSFAWEVRRILRSRFLSVRLMLDGNCHEVESVVSSSV